jgi:hypothetical protein
MKRFILVLTFSFIAPIALACECSSNEPFLTVAKKADLISWVKVKRFLTYKPIYGKPTPMSMEVEIIKKYKGNETRKTIVIWGDNGILYRPYLSQFVIGQSYVMGLFKGSIGRGNEGEKETDYFVSICGHYWLDAEKKTKRVTGVISAQEKSLSLKELKKRLLNNS